MIQIESYLVGGGVLFLELERQCVFVHAHAHDAIGQLGAKQTRLTRLTGFYGRLEDVTGSIITAPRLTRLSVL